MGLDCSHDAFHGSYGTFAAWRIAIEDAACVANLNYNSPLRELLDHSDCDGSIPSEHCDKIANELLILLPYLDDWLGCTAQFIAGLHAAAYSHEPLEFR